MPEGWAWTKIHCVSSEILYGVSESAKEMGKYKLLRITDIQDDQVNWDSVPFTDFPKDKVSNYILKNGDIVFARTGATVGKSYLIENLNIESIYASYLIRIRTSLLLNPRYMKYYFGSLTYWNQITDKSSGIGQPNVNGTSLANLYIPIPPYNEQERILPVIEKVFKLIDSLENDKDKLENLIKAAKSKILDLAIHGKLVPQDPNDEPAEELLKRIATSDNRPYKKLSGDEIPFELPETWIWQKLPDLCSIPITDGTHKTPTYSDEENGIPFLSSKDVTSSEIDWSKIKYITKELHEELYKRLAPQKNDILLAKNGTTGIAALVKDNTVFDIYVTLALIRPISKIIYPQYLLYIINSQFCKNQFNDHLTGIGVPNLHLVDINKTVIPLPPLSEQQRIVLKIEELFKYTDIININIKDC